MTRRFSADCPTPGSTFSLSLTPGCLALRFGGHANRRPIGGGLARPGASLRVLDPSQRGSLPLVNNLSDAGGQARLVVRRESGVMAWTTLSGFLLFAT